MFFPLAIAILVVLFIAVVLGVILLLICSSIYFLGFDLWSTCLLFPICV
jgi:hypothetical protein